MSKKPSLVALNSIVHKSLELIYKRKNKDHGVDKLIPAGVSEDVTVEIRATVAGQVFANEFLVPVSKGHPTKATISKSPNREAIICHLLERLPQAERDRFLIDYQTRFLAGEEASHSDVTMALFKTSIGKLKYDTGEKTTRAGAIATPEVKTVKRQKDKARKLA